MAGEFGRLGVGMGTLLGAGIMLGIAKNVISKGKKGRKSKSKRKGLKISKEAHDYAKKMARWREKSNRAWYGSRY